MSLLVKQIATRSRTVAVSLTLVPTHCHCLVHRLRVAALRAAVRHTNHYFLHVTCLQNGLWQARAGYIPVQQTWRHGRAGALVSLHPQHCRAPNPERKNKLLRNGRWMTHAPRRVECGAPGGTRDYNGKALFAAFVLHHGELLFNYICCCCCLMFYALCILLPLQHDMHK